MGVDLRVSNHVAYVTLNRPEAMNSFDPEAIAALDEHFNRIRTDDDIRVVVITGAGEKSFCTGTDMKKTPPPEEAMASIYLKQGIPILPRVKTIKPLIAAINGYAVGGGLELALACDLRIASTNAKFGLTEVKVASLAGLNGTQCLPRAMPQAVAMKMLLTGEMIGADEALRYGLVSDVVEPGEMTGLAVRYAERIAANAPLSVAAAKQAAQMGLDMPLEGGLAFAHLLWGLLRDTEDRKEGFAAFAEKRAPRWQGR